MKSFLFTLFLVSAFADVYGQNSGNVPQNSGNLEIKEKAETKKSNNAFNSAPEKAMEMEVEKRELEFDTIQVESATAAGMGAALDNNLASSIDSQRANYISTYTSFNQQRNQRSMNETQKETMDDLLRDLASSNPESFESYFFYYLNGQNDLTRSRALLKANELKPTDAMLQKEMMSYYVLVNKPDETRKALLNLSQNGVYSNSTGSYGEDLVNSAPENSTLITHGKEDSYAALYAQRVKREREDVDILSLEWLTSPQYRLKMKASGWNLPTSEFVDTRYLQELCHLNKDKSIAISMTLPKEYLIPILDKLYVSGLVFEYKEVPTDMTVRNEQLWNSTLNKDLIITKDNDLVKNYLPMLFQLKQAYEANGDSDAVNKIDAIINDLTKK